MAVVHLDPTAASARPGHLLGDSPHAHSRYLVADHCTQRHCLGAIIGHVLIHLVTDNEQVVFLSNGHNGLQDLAGIDRSSGIVRVDDQDAGHRRVILDMVLHVFKVWIPMVVGIEDVGNGPVSGMGRLSRRVGGVAGGRHNDPGSALEETKNF